MVKNNNRGITLVEILAAIAILSTIIILISSIHLFAVNQFNNQTEENDIQANIRLTLKTISKDIRKNPDQVTVINKPETILVINKNEYILVDNTIQKNGIELASHISKFDLEHPNNNKKLLTIEIQSIPTKTGDTIELSSTFFLQGAGE